MTVSVDLDPPRRALAVGAHPDDIEFGCGATLAKWAAAGTHVGLCICTDGSKGTWDPDADRALLVSVRAQEQERAAEVLGARSVTFLGAIDGELTRGTELVAALCRVVREQQPDVVLTHDPWRPYRLHPDHRAAGLLTVDAIVAARDPHFFPEQGMKPHRPATLLCFEPARVDHVENVDGFAAPRVDALLAHRSQWQSTMGIDGDTAAQMRAFVQEQHAELRAMGLHAGLRAAEAFARIDDL
jgi:LmbE family N-acetylglucosaminyl deacetylase